MVSRKTLVSLTYTDSDRVDGRPGEASVARRPDPPFSLNSYLSQLRADVSAPCGHRRTATPSPGLLDNLASTVV